VSALQELQERRAYECRLTADRALDTLDDAEAFLRDRGLMTRTADSALPSLFGACHEEPYAPGTPGFGQWPKTKWRWSGELLEREGIHGPKIHNGKTLYVTAETAALADPICRSELARMEAEGPEWALLLGHLANAGPSSAEDLRVELGLKARELKSLRYSLEVSGAILSLRLDESRIARWDHVFPEPSGQGGIEDLVVAGVRAAVVAPERELPRWFSWKRPIGPGLVDRLVDEGRLERPEPGWISLAQGE
jgi:hypothetical protein